MGAREACVSFLPAKLTLDVSTNLLTWQLPHGLQLHELQQSLREWDVVDTKVILTVDAAVSLEQHFASADVALQLIQDMISCSAFTSRVIHEDQLVEVGDYVVFHAVAPDKFQCLQAFEALGWAECNRRVADHSSWFLTSKGLAACQLSESLKQVGWPLQPVGPHGDLMKV